jgi:hypothetical protein
MNRNIFYQLWTSSLGKGITATQNSQIYHPKVVDVDPGTLNP